MEEIKAQDVYFDESGNTGNDLLNSEQPIYSYSAVAISEQEAKNIITEIRQKYNLQGNELKYSKMKKHSKGKLAIADILNKVNDKSAVVCFDKRYALCAKFFEYIFEPCLKKWNYLFYKAGFHHYIAYILYNIYFTNDNSSDLMVDFGKVMMNSYKVEPAKEFLNKYHSNKKDIDMSSFEELLKSFMTLNRDAILSEMEDVSGKDEVDKYTMDLASTSLFVLGQEMSRRYERIHAIYDNSKIINEELDMLNGMTGHKFTIPNLNYLSSHKEETMNIISDFEHKDSKQNAALQLADIIAGFAADAYKNKDKEKLYSLIANHILVQVVAPEIHKHGVIEQFGILYDNLFYIIVKNSENKKTLISEEAPFYLYKLAQICEFAQLLM